MRASAWGLCAAVAAGWLSGASHRRRMTAAIKAVNEPVRRNYEAFAAEIDAHHAQHRRCGGYTCPAARAIHARHYPGYIWP